MVRSQMLFRFVLGLLGYFIRILKRWATSLMVFQQCFIGTWVAHFADLTKWSNKLTRGPARRQNKLTDDWFYLIKETFHDMSTTLKLLEHGTSPYSSLVKSNFSVICKPSVLRNFWNKEVLDLLNFSDSYYKYYIYISGQAGKQGTWLSKQKA